MVRDFPFFSRRRLRRDSPQRISPPAHYLLATPSSTLPSQYTGHGSLSDDSILELERDRERKIPGLRPPKPKSNRLSFAEHVSQMLSDGPKKRPKLRREKRHISRAAARGFDFGIGSPPYQNGDITPPWEHYETGVPIAPYARVSNGTFGEGLWSPSPPTPPPSRPLDFRDPAYDSAPKRRSNVSPISPLDTPPTAAYPSMSLPSSLSTNPSVSKLSHRSSTRSSKSKKESKRVRFSPSRLNEPFSAPVPVEYISGETRKRLSLPNEPRNFLDATVETPYGPAFYQHNQSFDRTQLNGYQTISAYNPSARAYDADESKNSHRDTRRDGGYFSMDMCDGYPASNRPLSYPSAEVPLGQYDVDATRMNDIPDEWKGQDKVRRRIKEIERKAGERSSRKRGRHSESKVRRSEDYEDYEVSRRRSKRRSVQKASNINPMYGNRTFWVEDEDEDMWLPSNSRYY